MEVYMGKNIRFIVGLTLCFAILGCEGDTKGEDTAQFAADKFVVQSADLDIAQFLPPLLVESSDEKVVKVELTNDTLVITSVGRGSATVMVSDWRCKDNAARIEAQVSETGSITAGVYPFEGNLRKAIVKEPVTIDGSIGVEITPRNVKLMMDGVDFIEIDDTTVSTWINNLSAGLTARVGDIQAGEHIHEVTLIVSGTPTEASAEPLSITISAENTPIKVPVNVDPNPNAKFAID
jgi:hypothetical protein